MNSSSLATLKSLQSQLANDYMDFFASIRDSYPSADTSASSVYKRADNTVGRIQRALRLFGRMMGAGGTRATETELSELMKEVDAINKEKDALVKIAAKDNQLAAVLQNTEKATGVSKNDLHVSSDALKSSVQSRLRETNQSRPTEQGPTDGFGGFGSYAGAAGKYVLSSGLLAPILGPYAGPVSALFQVPFITRKLYRAAKGLGRATTWPFRKINNMFNKPSYGMEADSEDMSFASRPSIASSGVGEVEFKTAFDKSLYNFFDKAAFQTKWTRDVLDILSKAVKTDEKKSSIWSILKWLGLAGLGTALTKLVIDHWDTITKYGKMFWHEITEHGEEHWNTIKEYSVKFWEKAKESFQDTWKWVKESSEQVKTIVKTFSSVLDSLGFDTFGKKITATGAAFVGVTGLLMGGSGLIAGLTLLGASVWSAYSAFHAWEESKEAKKQARIAQEKLFAGQQRDVEIYKNILQNPNVSQQKREDARRGLAYIARIDIDQNQNISDSDLIEAARNRRDRDEWKLRGDKGIANSPRYDRSVPSDSSNLILPPMNDVAPGLQVPSNEVPKQDPLLDLNTKDGQVSLLEGIQGILYNGFSSLERAVVSNKPSLAAIPSQNTQGVTDPLQRLNSTRRYS